MVWREGMAVWVPLDSVLGPQTTPTAARRRESRRLVWAITAAAVLKVAAVATLGFFAVKFVQRVRQVVQASGENDPADATEAAGKEITVSTNSLTE